MPLRWRFAATPRASRGSVPGVTGCGMADIDPPESFAAQVKAKIDYALRQSPMGIHILVEGRVHDADVVERIATLYELALTLRDIAIETAAEVDSMRAAIAELRRED